MPPTAQRCLQRLSSDAGFGLIEVVVSAGLLALVVAAVLAGIDGPALIASRNQSRSVATALAQRDQDRMRAMRAVDLSDYAPAPYTVTVGQINYTVTSRATWVSDSSGTLSCSNNSALAQYLDLTSTVSWPALKGPPVVMETLLAPPNGAYNLIAQITNQAGGGVSGLPIAISGPASKTRSTNSLGCAYFGSVPAGSYAATFSASGWVDPAGVTAVTVNATVSQSGTASITHLYGQAAAIGVSFDTQVGSGVQSAQAVSITATNAGIPTPPSVRAYKPGIPQSSINASALFPFTDGYDVYAGTCSDSNPTTYDPNYFASNAGHVAIGPGASPTVTIREPAINLLVTKNGSSAPLQGAHATVTPAPSPPGQACTDTYPAQTTNSAGALPAPAFPFGHYSVCADFRTGGTTYKAKTAVTNSNPNGNSTPVSLVVPTSGTSTGSCP